MRTQGLHMHAHTALQWFLPASCSIAACLMLGCPLQARDSSVARAARGAAVSQVGVSPTHAELPIWACAQAHHCAPAAPLPAPHRACTSYAADLAGMESDNVDVQSYTKRLQQFADEAEQNGDRERYNTMQTLLRHLAGE